MPYSTPTNSAISTLKREINDIHRKIAIANAPSGTQAAQTIQKIQAAIVRLDNLVAFLTGARGYSSNSESWGDSNANGDHTDFTFMNYDPSYDAYVDFEGPESGIISVDLAAWIDVKANAYSADATKPYGVNVRGGVSFDIVTTSGAMAYAVRRVDGVQLTTETWGVNNTNVVGATTSNTIMVSGLTPGMSYKLRTRHGRYGYAQDRDGNPIAMPDKGWWVVTIDNLRVSVVLVSGATINDQTSDDGKDTTGGTS